jgi:hypothetical protein
VPANFDCRLHHCSQPNVGESSYLPPPSENQLQLVVSQSISDNNVPLGSNISYSCAQGTFIESPEADPTRTQVGQLFKDIFSDFICKIKTILLEIFQAIF